MTTTTTVAGLTLPENTDLLNAQQTFGGYATGADGVLIPRFATTTTRDAAFASGATAGQMCVVTNSGTFAEPMIYDGVQWNFIGPVIENRITSVFTTTSTTLANVTGLSASVRAGYVYEFELFLFGLSAVSGAGYSFGYTFPSGTVVDGVVLGQGRTATSVISTANFSSPSTALGTTGTPLGTGNTFGFARGIVTVGGTGGTFQVQAASRAGSSISLLVDSSLVLRRIA